MSELRTSDKRVPECPYCMAGDGPCVGHGGMKKVAPLASNEQSIAARDVLAERQRQIQTEGWTPEHDDRHSNFELTLAAVCYALCAARPKPEWLWGNGETPQWWPWAKGWWKPRGARPELVRAAALIIAEIERLDRANGVSGASAAETFAVLSVDVDVTKLDMRPGSIQFVPAGPTANECWESINALIKPGQLQGNGIDATAERNGLILAANTIAAMIQDRAAEKASSVPCCRTWLDTDGETHDPTCNVQNELAAHKSTSTGESK